MIVLIDNYDSFAHNLARYLRLLSGSVVVVRNDAIDVGDHLLTTCQALVVSPGPCSPTEAGNALRIVESVIGSVPVLGVCLGHQAIVQSLGGRIVRASQPMHGRTSPILHDGKSEFAGQRNPFLAARYHSLVAERDSLPAGLEVSAWTHDGTVMAVRHRECPVFGWQFHPESILTECGLSLLRAFLKLADLPVVSQRTFDREMTVSRRKMQTSSEPVMPLPRAWNAGQ